MVRKGRREEERRGPTLRVRRLLRRFAHTPIEDRPRAYFAALQSLGGPDREADREAYADGVQRILEIDPEKNVLEGSLE